MAVREESKAGGDGRQRRPIQWAAFRDLWERQRRDVMGPAVRTVTLYVAGGLWAVALLLVFLTWNGARERPLVAEQVPYLVSGGLSALLLTLMGSAVFLYGVLASPPGGDGPESTAAEDERER